MSNIGVIIKEYREKNQLSMESFAKLIGISQSYLSQIEAGKKVPSDKVINLLRKVMNESLTDDTNSIDDVSTELSKKKIVTGAKISASIGATEFTIEIRTTLPDELNVESEAERSKLKGKYAFESPIIIETIADFFSENKEELRKKIIDNLKKEIDIVRNTYEE